jgi:hypothetical protein
MNNSAKTLLMLTVTRTCYFSIPYPYPTLTPSSSFLFPPSTTFKPPTAVCLFYYPSVGIADDQRTHVLQSSCLSLDRTTLFFYSCFLVHAVVRSFTHNCTTFSLYGFTCVYYAFCWLEYPRRTKKHLALNERHSRKRKNEYICAQDRAGRSKHWHQGRGYEGGGTCFLQSEMLIRL